MSLVEIANEDMTLVTAEVNPPGVIEVTMTVGGASSVKTKANGKGVYKDALLIKLTNITANAAGATTPDPLSVPPLFIPATISATATKVKADGVLVLRQNDISAVVAATPLIPGPPPVPYPITFKVKISVAGQIKVKAQ